MLQFDAQQLEALAKHSFAVRMTEILASLGYMEEEQDENLAHEEIFQQLEQAKCYGFTDEQDCARWIVAAWCLGADFHKKIAAISELLNRKDVGARYKSLALEVFLRGIFVSLAGQGKLVL